MHATSFGVKRWQKSLEMPYSRCQTHHLKMTDRQQSALTQP
ncbi:unnamed protein product [Schistosoma mattheei]|uniref:Uncharacterized protein n=1 Tax=Schistosoma mattheei TaxID=31246 RepID=A0A183NLT1_9TREM|nr:unnamed protein product [Schistosoma mattheei]